MDELLSGITENWHIWLVSALLVVAAVIDGYKLKVPNWLTFPMIISGWIYSFAFYGWAGLGWSLAGTAVGLGLLLPAYAIGGMGAGDVKLLAGVGAWVWATHTFWAFAVSAVVGGLIALAMVLYRRAWAHHKDQFLVILTEIFIIRDPNQLAALAAERKGRMLLLPYGIPIAVGTIAYFAWWGMYL
ncbi:MAG TPA: prepilin peptidase [Planctomycetaceae bacterium]|nr:prepilin peptidase [Planctomycetaceae bacterium]